MDTDVITVGHSLGQHMIYLGQITVTAVWADCSQSLVRYCFVIDGFSRLWLRGDSLYFSSMKACNLSALIS